MPARSSPSGSSIAAVTARVSVLAVRARAPSIAAIATTAASEKWSASSARAPKAAASAAVDRRQRRSAAAAARAGRRGPGSSSAGRKPVPRKSAAVARALSVRSKTSTERAIDPEPVAQLVDRVGGGQAPEGGPPQGVAQAWISHVWPGDTTAFLHNFPCSCTSFRQVVLQTSQAIEKFSHEACADTVRASTTGRSSDMGLRNVRSSDRQRDASVAAPSLS